MTSGPETGFHSPELGFARMEDYCFILVSQISFFPHSFGTARFFNSPTHSHG